MIPERLTRSVPWTVSNLLVLSIATAAGLLLVLSGWFGASGSVNVDTQVRWTNVASAGVIVLGAGNLMWLLAGRRAVGELRVRVIVAVRETVEVAHAAPVEEPPDVHEGTLVASGNMQRYHRPGCLLAAGKDVHTASEMQHRRQGRRPCGVCLPAADEAGGA